MANISEGTEVFVLVDYDDWSVLQSADASYSVGFPGHHPNDSTLVRYNKLFRTTSCLRVEVEGRPIYNLIYNAESKTRPMTTATTFLSKVNLPHTYKEPLKTMLVNEPRRKQLEKDLNGSLRDMWERSCPAYLTPADVSSAGVIDRLEATNKHLLNTNEKLDKLIVCVAAMQSQMEKMDGPSRDSSKIKKIVVML